MKLLFIQFIYILFFIIFSSCGSNNKSDCKKLIVKTWQYQSVEFNRDELKEYYYRKNGQKISEPEVNNYIELFKKNCEARKDELLLAFTGEGNILDNNTNVKGQYKLTLDCNKLFQTTWLSVNGNRIVSTDTSLIKELTDEKLVTESSSGVIISYKSKN